MLHQQSKILIAMPSLKDSLFTHSVILMGEMNTGGALGFIINLPTSTKARDALEMMKIIQDKPLEHSVLFGGPVQTDFFWVIHSSEFSCKTTMKLNQEISLSYAPEVFPLLNDERCPQIYLTGVGYAGWAPNQLDREIEEGSWWLTEYNLENLLHTPFNSHWNQMMESLGVNPDHLYDPKNSGGKSIN